MITIQISDRTWKELNQRKEVGETFDSVIQKALEESNLKKEEKENEL